MTSRHDDARFKSAVAEHEKSGMGRIAALNAAVVTLRQEDAEARRVSMAERDPAPRQQTTSKAAFDGLVAAGEAAGLDKVTALNQAIVQSRKMSDTVPVSVKQVDDSRAAEARRFEVTLAEVKRAGYSGTAALERAVTLCKLRNDGEIEVALAARDTVREGLVARGMTVAAAEKAADARMMSAVSKGAFRGKELASSPLARATSMRLMKGAVPDLRSIIHEAMEFAMAEARKGAKSVTAAHLDQFMHQSEPSVQDSHPPSAA